jgi:hypothetical protein
VQGVYEVEYKGLFITLCGNSCKSAESNQDIHAAESDFEVKNKISYLPETSYTRKYWYNVFSDVTCLYEAIIFTEDGWEQGAEKNIWTEEGMQWREGGENFTIQIFLTYTLCQVQVEWSNQGGCSQGM